METDMFFGQYEVLRYLSQRRAAVLQAGEQLWKKIKAQIKIVSLAMLYMSAWSFDNQESPAYFENRIKPKVYLRRITRSTMYEQVPFC